MNFAESTTIFTNWLKHSQRNPCPYDQFGVIDIEEATDVSPELRTYLISLLRSERFDPAFLEAMASELGWEDVKNLILNPEVRTITTGKRGEFGEILIGSMLEQFHEYSIPVRKLRFKLTSGQTLPATDVLALKLDAEGAIVEVCFVESKLRTESDTMAAVDGFNQLKKDYESRLPDILKFVAARLHDRRDPLFNAFRAYMGDRRDTKERDTFRLSLCWDCEHWSERALENLQENGVDSPKLVVHVIQLKRLRELTDGLFREAGLTEVSDDD